MKGYQIFAAGCIHIPFEDRSALRVFTKALEKFKPAKVILAGDIMDSYTVSKYPKNANRSVRFQNELSETTKFLTQIRKILPHSEITYLAGNHDGDRIESYLATNAKELAGLKCLEMPSLLGLDKLNIDWVPYGQLFPITDNFVVTHGTAVRSKAGMSAHAEMIKAGCSGLSFHTHRQALVNYTTFSNQSVWVEGGCLCDPKQEYIKGTADWQQGFCVLNVLDNDVYPELVPIKDGIGFYRGSKIRG